MSTRTAEEKARKRAERLRKRRERHRLEMREDVRTLRRILYGTKKPS